MECDLKMVKKNILRRIKFVPILQTNEKIIEQVRKWRNSPEIRKYMYNDHYIIKKEHQVWFKSLRERNDAKVWVIYLDAIPVGVADLININYKNKITDWGFYIGDKNFRGRGLGKLILYNLMNYVFEEMNLHRMYTMVLENNAVAINLYKKMGFKEEGTLRKHLVRRKKYIDVIPMAILKEEWESVRDDLKNKYNFVEVQIR